MKAADGRILLEPVEAREIRLGNLVIPDVAVKDNALWRVYDVGNGVKSVKPGDYVLCPVHAIYEIEFRGRKFAVVREEHIYAILDETEVYG